MPAPLRTVASNSGCDAMGIRYIGPGELEDVPGAMLALTGARPVLRCGNRRKASDVRTGKGSCKRDPCPNFANFPYNSDSGIRLRRWPALAGWAAGCWPALAGWAAGCCIAGAIAALAPPLFALIIVNIVRLPFFRVT